LPAYGEPAVYSPDRVGASTRKQDRGNRTAPAPRGVRMGGPAGKIARVLAIPSRA
jgi:hypothetical protein